jgi:hypothetical protein
MQPLVSINFEPRSLALTRSLLADLVGDKKTGASAFDVALQAAISRTLVTGKARIARRIAEEVRLRIGDIKNLIDTKTGGYGKPQGLIVVTRRTSWLADFLSGAKLGRLARGTRGPLTLSVRKKPSGKYGTREVIQRGWAGFMPRAQIQLGIFQREGKARLPIHRLRGPTALGILIHAHGEGGAATILDEIIAALAEVMQKNLESQTLRFLK